MKYLTAKELSEKWNITRCRIAVLAREGRIEGARLYGKSWVFPEDAQKPADGRTKPAMSERLKEDHFRYPAFEFRDMSSFNPPLTNEELTLKKTIEAFNAFRFKDAGKLLGSLPEKTHNRYIRIPALYCRSMISIFICDIAQFSDSYGKLKTELQDDFPHKEEMSEYIHEIDASIGENSYYSQNFHTVSMYKYHSDFLPRLCNLASVWLSFGEKNINPDDLTSGEIYCAFLERTDSVFDLQAVHAYLACAYSMLDRKEECICHFRRALELAGKYNMFYTIASLQYSYAPRTLTYALQTFPDDFRKKVLKCNRIYHKCLIQFTGALQVNCLYKLMTDYDYIYIAFAVQKLTNREIASRMHVSVSSVSKRFSRLYSRLGVSNRDELVALYYSLTDRNGNKES